MPRSDKTTMRNTLVLRGALVAALIVTSVTRARAQIYESVGIRAQGMGGAFVAVADDASATWWNPAGLAAGAYVNGIVEWGTVQDPHAAAGGDVAAPSWRSKTRGVAVGYPALGLSYYRLQVSEIQTIGPTAGSGTGRQDQGLASVRLRSLVLQQFGATVGQSVGGHFVAGSTLKLVRGALASATGVAGAASLERAGELEGDTTSTTVDLDVGVMAKFGGVSAAVVVKNMKQPAFTAGDDRLELRRQARAGLAATMGSRGSVGPVTVAVDADLTRTATATGDQRHIAGGAEAWLFGRSLGLRGGASANTIGNARPTAGGGASLALRSGVYVEGQVTFGSDEERRGWGVTLRVTF
jgi:hypothetical protein